MPRRRKPRAADELMDLIARLPWWAGVSLAVVSYLLLHKLAAQPLPTATNAAQVGALVSQSMWRALALAGQYVVPLICLMGAAVSALRGKERRRLVQNVTQSQAAGVLDHMSWQQFEQLVGEAFRLQGYRVMQSGGSGPDGGVDLVIAKNGETYLVQCKQWRAFKVGVEVVRELYGVMAAGGAAGGFVVTSGRFTDEAVAFASGRNVRLIDGPKLHGLIRQAQDARQADSDLGGQSTAPAVAAMSATVLCPLCAKAMVKRVARRGPKAGSEFWGCTGYPACTGTRPI
ncbi:restriction endonuclease [Caldimonas sp. KR1-144]|uniref:restriction endonuclease n=1 Tax=Caldimonas sp. KR1-144 TaxID=3400911 RepID=UPI003C0DF4BB